MDNFVSIFFHCRFCLGDSSMLLCVIAVDYYFCIAFHYVTTPQIFIHSTDDEYFDSIKNNTFYET